MSAELLKLLETRVLEIRRLEAEAKALAADQDQAGFESRMRAKAQLLSAIAEDADEALDALPEDRQDQVAETLAAFSASAAGSLKTGSPFWMSALLYPEDHKAGEPNDLERLVERIRRMG